MNRISAPLKETTEREARSSSLTCKNREKRNTGICGPGFGFCINAAPPRTLILDFSGSKTDKNISVVYKLPNLSCITTLRCITTPPQNKNGKHQPKELHRKKNLIS